MVAVFSQSGAEQTVITSLAALHTEQLHKEHLVLLVLCFLCDKTVVLNNQISESFVMLL